MDNTAQTHVRILEERIRICLMESLGIADPDQPIIKIRVDWIALLALILALITLWSANASIFGIPHLAMDTVWVIALVLAVVYFFGQLSASGAATNQSQPTINSIMKRLMTDDQKLNSGPRQAETPEVPTTSNANASVGQRSVES